MPAGSVNGFGRLPLLFEPNVGQAGPEVRFLSRASGAKVSLSPTAATLELPGSAGPARLGMQLIGARASAAQVGSQRTGARVNDYASGTGPFPGIPTYRRVVSKEVYPGIDLAWYGKAGELEYDFIVDPGADPTQISFGFEGATSLHRVGGELVVGFVGGTLRHRAPTLYQDMGGRRHKVAGRFVLEGDRVRFAVGSYDRRRPLVIDPVIAWASFLGGSGFDEVSDVAVDANGNAYVVGSVVLAPWSRIVAAGPPPRAGAAMAYHAGTKKLVLFGGRGPAGELLGDTWLFDGASWSEAAVSGLPARAYARLAPDPTGRLVLFGGEDASGPLGDTWVFDGNTWSAPPLVGDRPSSRTRAALVAAGVGPSAVVLFGGRAPGGALLDDTWLWNGLNWIAVSPAASPSARSEAATATDAAGTAHLFGGRGSSGVLADLWTWSGSSWQRQAESAAVSPSGRRGAVLVGDDDGVLRLVGGKAGTGLAADRWTYRAGEAQPWTKEKTTLTGGPGPRVGAAAARHDAAGTGVVVGGDGPGATLGDAWLLQPVDPFNSAWVAKFSSTGRAKYISFLGVAPGGRPARLNVAADTAGNAYVAGSAGGATRGFATTPGAYQPSCNAQPECDDGFLVVLDPQGGLRYATWIGGSQADFAWDMSLGPGGTVYLAGRTDSFDFPSTAGAYCRTLEVCNGGGFLVKLSPQGTGTGDLVYATYYESEINAVAVDSEGTAYLTGITQNTELSTTPGAFQSSCALNQAQGGTCTDAFVAKLAPAGQGEADLLYATYLGGGCCTVPGAPAQGGNAGDWGTAIALGPKGSVYVAGQTGSTDFPVTPGAFDGNFKCFSNFGCMGFLAKLRLMGAGSADLRYATYLGSGAADNLRDLAVDRAGRAVIAGRTAGAGFPTNKPVQDRHSGGYDAVLAVLDPLVNGDGSGKVSATNGALVFSTFLGGSMGDEANGLALDSLSNAYIVGTTSSADFQVTTGSFQRKLAGDWDGLFVKISGL